MSTRAVGDTTKVDDQIHDRKLADAQAAAAKKQLQRLQYWMQMGGDTEFGGTEPADMGGGRGEGRGSRGAGRGRGPGGTSGTGGVESTNSDGVLATAESPMQGMGLATGGMKAKQSGGMQMHATNSTIQVQTAQAMAPLSNLLAEAPPDDVMAPASAYALATDWTTQRRLANRNATSSSVHFPLGSSTFKKLGEFSAVFSSSEQNQVLNAMQRVYDRQLQSLAGSAGLTEEQRGAGQAQLDANVGKIMKQLNPLMQEAVKRSADAQPGLDTGGPATGALEAGQLQMHQANPMQVQQMGQNAYHLSAVEQNSMEVGYVDGATPPEETQQSQETQPSQETQQTGESGDVDGKVGAVDGLDEHLQSLLSGLDADGAAALANMDVDAMVQMVLMEVATDQEDEIRKLAEKIQLSNQMKAKQRELQSIYRHAKASLNDAMRAEYEALKAKGLIGEGVSLDDYKSWRKVVVGEPARDPGTGELLTGPDGKILMTEPSLPEPSPPIDLPPFLTEDQKTEDIDTSQAGGPANPNTTSKGAAYGLTDDQYQMLRDYFMDSAGPAVWDIYTKTPEGFAQWMEGELMLEPTSDVEGIAANNTKIDEFLASVGDLDTGMSDVDETNSADALALVGELELLCQAYAADPDPGTLAMIQTKMNEIRRFSDSHYMSDFALLGITALLEDKLRDNGVLDALPSGSLDACKDGILNNKGQTPYDAEGRRMTKLTDEQIEEWQEIQEDAGKQIDEASLYTYGLNEEQIAILTELSKLDGSGFNGDMSEWLEAMGLVSANDPEFGSETNAQKIREFMDELGTRATPVSGGNAIDGLESVHLGQVENIDELEFGGGNTGEVNGDALAKIREKFDFATDGGIDAVGYGLPSEWGPGFERMWLNLPAGKRAEYGNDFQQFIAALGLNSNDGPGNIAKMRAFLEGLGEGSWGSFEAMLDVAEHPIDQTKFAMTEVMSDAVQYMWTMLTEEERASFGNDINRWLTEGVGMSADPSQGAQNIEKFKQYNTAKYGGYGDLFNEQLLSGNFDMDKKWTISIGGDSGEIPEFVQDMIDAGLIEAPDKAPEFTTQAKSNNDPTTGDNLVTGAKAQGIPEGSDGRMMSLAEFEAFEQDAKDQLDSLSEISELDMLEMQLKNDRRQRAMEALSAVMKKVANTADGIISNLK